jgi:hypothetical protein
VGAPQDVKKGLDLFRTLIFDTTVEAVLAAYTGGLTKIPIIGFIIEDLVLDFADKLYDKLGGVVIFGTILFVDVQHRRAFDEASIGLKKIAIEKGINSPEFKEAHEIERQALKKLVQFGVARPGITG